MRSDKIAILGAGNLGQAIANGIVKKQLVDASQVTVTRRDLTSLRYMEKNGFSLTQSNSDAVKNASIIMLCVQPQQLDVLLEEINKSLSKDKLIISVITGISIQQIQAKIESENPVVRAMPNTAIEIGESMTCLAFSESALPFSDQVVNLFNAVGKSSIIEEKLMQAATVLGASGIAFVMRYLRAATQGGIQMGFDADDAQFIAMQTAKGAASILLEKGTHPENEIDRVTTPQGCTITGLNEMEHKGFSSALIQGLMTSFRKIYDMDK
ncbi:MAG: pyrroline-5-carboxylate reductase [Bacteroidota bacterium]